MRTRTYNKFAEEEIWTEEKINFISGEDDRYEYKSGLLLDKKVEEIEEILAKEICAFANSFGGTLFLGIKDKTYEFDGVIKTYKRNTIDWLERKIPNLLSFRLPYFRISEVHLSKATESRIGDNKTVISIDIFDSVLAPHQVSLGTNSRSDKVYYYRENSSSIRAPHSYMAYLWSRSNQNMSKVVRQWFIHYLNPLISTIEKFAFKTSNSYLPPIENHKICIFNYREWNELNSELAAQQFLRTFPIIKERIDSILLKVEEIDSRNEYIRNLIIKSTAFFDLLKTICSNYYLKTGEEKYKPQRKNRNELLSTIRDIKGFSYSTPQLGNSLEAFKLIFTHHLTFVLLEYRSQYGELGGLMKWCKDEIAGNFFDEKVDYTIKFQKKELKALSQELLLLHQYLDDFRYELAVKHNTTYF
jgi:hypothetical protein